MIEALHPRIYELLRSRGIENDKEIEYFLKPDYHRDVHDPFLFDDMQKAVDRVLYAVSHQEPITIYGDYDADGVPASAILHEVIASLGGDVRAYFNHREKDGYGIHTFAVEKLAAEGTKLIITTDSGISNGKEIGRANALGVDVIITDHHTVPCAPEDLPAAYAIIHPRVRAERYPFLGLSGGGSAFKLAQGIMRSTGMPDEQLFLDLVTISTIADFMPLLGENRVFLRYGLPLILEPKRVGLQAILSHAPEYIRTRPIELIQFFIAPLINAAGRMDHASKAFALLTAKTFKEADAIVKVLIDFNTERQKVTQRMYRQAKKQCDEYPHTSQILVGYSPDWSLGVLGLVAGKLVRDFNKPVFLMTEGEGKVSGVARSTPVLHVADTLSAVSHLFERHGGHQGAGGFALKQGVLPQTFKDEMACVQPALSTAESGAADVSYIPMHLSEIDHEFVRQLSACEPWGEGHAKPQFILRECQITDVMLVGKTKKHIRITVTQDHSVGRIIGIKQASIESRLTVGDMVDFVCEIDYNEWNGQPDIKLSFIDCIFNNALIYA